MIEKIDVKDKRIIYELDKNARSSIAQIAKKTGLSTEATHYRIKKLEEKGIITQYQTEVNYHKLGLHHFKICLQFKGITLEEEEAMYNILAKIPQIVWIAKCRGEWDCIISVTVESIPEMDKIKDKVLSIASKNVATKAISLSTNIWSSPRKYFLQETDEAKQMSISTEKIDSIDVKILRILSMNARAQIIDIARKLDITVKIATTRVKKLLQKEIIHNYRLSLDHNKLGIHFFKTFIYFKNPEEQRVKQLIAEINNHQNIIHTLKVIGDWDLDLNLEFENATDFETTRQSLMNKYADIIQRIAVIDIVKVYKYTFFYK